MRKVQLIDSHTAGESTRLVFAGTPELGTGSVADRWRSTCSYAALGSC